MLVQTTWKSRPLSPEQANRMMSTWGKIEARMAEDPNLERINWYINADASGGSTVVRAADGDAAHQFSLEISLALSEFLELESRVVLELETAMPGILKGMEYING
ncbi:MAG TPA: hypothetical protein VFA11_15365 [Acidimicrobiales bacterium]|nr:hypothetical protein [Acidimicrobiales bacterium]